MAGESSARRPVRSNRRGLKYEPKNIRPVDGRIPFSVVAKVAAPRKTIQYLVERTGCDPSTAKRWLSGKSPASSRANNVVFADIMARVG